MENVYNKTNAWIFTNVWTKLRLLIPFVHVLLEVLLCFRHLKRGFLTPALLMFHSRKLCVVGACAVPCRLSSSGHGLYSIETSNNFSSMSRACECPLGITWSRARLIDKSVTRRRDFCKKHWNQWQCWKSSVSGRIRVKLYQTSLEKITVIIVYSF